MRVGVDARSVTGPRGVTRYTTELLRALVREFPDDRFVLFVPGRADLPAVADIVTAPNVSVYRHRFPSRVLFGSAALLRRPRLERLIGEPVDVVWVPAPAPVALVGDVPAVLTLHDVTWETRPRDFTPYERVWHRIARPRALAAGMRSLIAPTIAVRDELVARWDVDPARIHVVPEGERGLDAELVFAGDGRLAASLEGAGPGVRLLGWRDVVDLEALYQGATALVFASRLEGFALPVYESLARGTPAIITDLPVFGSELSPGVVRVPVDDERALGDAMLRLAGDAKLRSTLGAAGRAVVSGLTWERAARTTRDVFAQTLAG